MIKIKDLAFVRYRTTDLDRMEKFLLDFGMQVAARTSRALYLRGSGPSHHIYITELAPRGGFIGLAFEAESEDDLHRVADGIAGASPVEPIEEPGGGKRVRLLDPTGYLLEIVHGIQQLAEIDVREALALNTDRARNRLNRSQRPVPGPAHVRRIGHLILRVDDYPLMRDFYASFGLTVSDEIYQGEPDNVITGFLKCDRGNDYTDHHTLGLARGRGALTVDHSAYECIDFDDVVQGGLHLQGQSYVRAWGVGRHFLGSQIFDYWRDPFGFKLEHWTDGDLVNIDTPRNLLPAGDDGPAAISQWGPMPEDYLKTYPGTDSIGPLG